MQTPPQSTSLIDVLRLRGMIVAFVGGLMLGLLLGWIFSGVVSVFVRIGLLFLLLLPLIVIAYVVWRARRAVRRFADGGDPGRGVRVYSWPQSGTDPRRPVPPRAEEPTARAEPERREDIIDLEFEEIRRDVDRSDGEGRKI